MELDDEEGPIDQYLSQIPGAIKSSKVFKCETCSHQPDNPWPAVIKVSYYLVAKVTVIDH
jgi:hypothetical protein